MGATFVSRTDVFGAHIKVFATEKAIINANGRGFEADNKDVKVSNDVLEFTVRSSTSEGLAKKVAAVMATLEED